MRTDESDPRLYFILNWLHACGYDVTYDGIRLPRL